MGSVPTSENYQVISYSHNSRMVIPDTPNRLYDRKLVLKLQHAMMVSSMFNNTNTFCPMLQYPILKVSIMQERLQFVAKGPIKKIYVIVCPVVDISNIIISGLRFIS